MGIAIGIGYRNRISVLLSAIKHLKTDRDTDSDQPAFARPGKLPQITFFLENISLRAKCFVILI
jgi:hypothetical protein